MKRHAVVEIEWVDAGSRGRWASIDEYKQMTPLVCRSTGYLVHKGKEKVIIVQSRCLSNGDMVDGFVVPRGSIKRLRYLKGRL